MSRKVSLFALMMSIVILVGHASHEVISVAAQAGGETGVVTRIVDGDTIQVRLNNANYSVRYIGVNTPERGDACYAEATAANRTLVEGASVRLERDVSNTDRYGRLLRYVYVGDTLVNAQLVEEGWAEAVAYPPDTEHASAFEALEATARADGLGCHAFEAFGPAGAATEGETYYVISQNNVNVRACEQTNCDIITTLAPASEVTVIDEVEGQFTLGSALWYVVLINGQEAYVHGSLLSNTPASRPVAQQPANPPAQQPPAQQQPAVQPPIVQPTQPPAPASGFMCNGRNDLNCSHFSTRAQAQAHLDACGDEDGLDGDDDGLACETLP